MVVGVVGIGYIVVELEEAEEEEEIDCHSSVLPHIPASLSIACLSSTETCFSIRF